MLIALAQRQHFQGHRYRKTLFTCAFYVVSSVLAYELWDM